jgi:hypothetical protein
MKNPSILEDGKVITDKIKVSSLKSMLMNIMPKLRKTEMKIVLRFQRSCSSYFDLNFVIFFVVKFKSLEMTS